MERSFFLLCMILSLSCHTSQQENALSSADPDSSIVKSGKPMQLNFDDINWLSQHAGIVFIGKLDTKKAVEERKGIIVTQNVFRIERVLKGTYTKDTIWLNTLGGVLGETTMRVSHMPVFQTGSTYLLFTAPDRAKNNPVLNNDKGVFLIQDEKVFSYAGSIIQNVENGKIIYGTEFLATGDTTNKRAANPGTVSNEKNIKAERTVPRDTSYFPLSKLVTLIQ